MARITEAEIKNHISSENYSPVYLVYGNEDYLVRYYSEGIIKSVSDGPFSDFNLSKFSEAAPLSEITAAAKMLPAMARHRCIAVYNPDISKYTDNDLEEFESYLKAPNESSVMVFYFIGTSPGNSSKSKKFISTIEKYGSTIRTDERSESELVKILCTGAGKRGCTMSAATARILISRVSADMNALLCELEKLCSYRPGQEITDSDIKKLCPSTLTEDAFDMIRAINSGNVQNAFSILKRLFDDRQEPIAVFGALVYSYVNMYRVTAAKKSRMPLEDFAKAVGIKSPYALKNAQRDAAKLGPEKLLKSLSVLDVCDQKLKSSPVDRKIILEETLVKLFETARGGAA